MLEASPKPALVPPHSFSCLPTGSCEVTGRVQQLLEVPGTRRPEAAPLGSLSPVTEHKCDLLAKLGQHALDGLFYGCNVHLYLLCASFVIPHMAASAQGNKTVKRNTQKKKGCLCQIQ